MRPEPEPDRQARGCCCNARNCRERPVPPPKLDHRGARLATSTLDDPPTQRLRWRRPFGRVGQGGDRLAEQSKLLGSIPRSLGDAARTARARRRRVRRARMPPGDRGVRGSSGLRVIRRRAVPVRLEIVRQEIWAPSAYQSPKARLAAPSAGARRPTEPRASVRPNPVVSRVIESAVNAARIPSAPDCERLAVDRAHEQDPDSGAAPDPVEQADREGTERRPGSGVLVCDRAVRVEMSVRVRPVFVLVRVEGAAAPAQEQPDRESCDQEADRRLSRSLDGRGQGRAVEHDRESQDEEVARGLRPTPSRASPRRSAPFGRTR